MNINFGINFDGILKFNKSFWVKVGSWAIKEIRADAKAGIFQTDEWWDAYYTNSYRDLKNNDFRYKTTKRYERESDDLSYSAGLGTTKGGRNVYRVKDGKAGQRIKQYEGVSIVNKDGSKVTMIVTGQTLQGLKITATLNNGVQIAYNVRDINKILGNQKPGLNRRLVGLNNKNMKRLQELFINEVATQVAKNFVGKTVLNFKL